MKRNKLYRVTPWSFAWAILRQFFATARESGPRRAVRAVRHRISEAYHDWRLGIRTWNFVELRELGIDNPACNDYQPTDYRSLKRAFRYLRVRGNEEVFLDFGSGMGRAVLVAARYPFRRVMGVEVSHRLNTIAQEHLERAREKLRCKNVELINADASAFRIPADVTVAYFYNPFGAELVSTVMRNIRASLLETPRKFTILYKNPSPSGFDGYVGRCEWLIKRREFKCYSGHPFVIYEATP